MRMFLVLMLLSTSVFAERVSKSTIQQICEKTGFSDCKLVSALAAVESKYNSKKYNPEKTGSIGLLQIQCGTARWLGKRLNRPELLDCNKLYDPNHNIKVGILYLRDIRERHNIKDIRTWFAAYNAGAPIRCRKFNPGFCTPGQFINQAYVNDLYAVYKQLGEPNVGL